MSEPTTRTCPICGEQIDAHDYADAFETEVDETPSPVRRMLNRKNYHDRTATVLQPAARRHET